MSTHESALARSAATVRDACLCLHLQRAARAVARTFDDALRPLEVTNGQFSLLVSLNRSDAPTIGATATLLGTDRTTVTAALKALQRRGLVTVSTPSTDRRSRSLRLTLKGQRLVANAMPLWKEAHARTEGLLTEQADALRAMLRAIAASVPE